MAKKTKTEFSYKDIDTLKAYVTPQGSIKPRENTGLTKKQQRHLTKAVKRARHLALLKFTQTI
ncbi:MAG: 30S ribosomal protein S18 [Patescibacteria group bacterium]|nr:30S ribosomal protein S18 [Patescibacteria group bacterium]